jgi:hypothetical protein
LKHLLLPALVALGLAAAQADDQKFTFALPEHEGLISLGVFDAKGNLVRQLASEAKEQDFTIGLNGLITSWDGRDDAGKPQPAGKYFIRGYVITEKVKSEGIAYHFNDWVTEDASPRIARISDFAVTPDTFALLGNLADGQPFAARYAREGDLVWKTLLDPSADGPESIFQPERILRPSGIFAPSRIAASASTVVVAREGALSAFPLPGESKTITAAPAALAIEDTALLSLEGKSLVRRSLPTLEPVATSETPEEFQSLASGPKHQLLGGTSKQLGVWKLENDRWQKLDVPFRVTSVSFGKDSTIWLTGQEIDSGREAAGQFAPDGTFLRKYYDGFSVRRIHASDENDEITILEADDTGVTRFRVLRQEKKTENSEVAWKILLEKSITPCARFGIVDGRLVPDAGSTPQQDTVEMRVSPAGLSPVGRRVNVKAASYNGAVWLEINNLRTLRVGDFSAPNPRLVARKVADSSQVQLFAGDGSVVAEFLVSGLDQIEPFDAGEIDLP